MALELCNDCGTRFSVGALTCPHCGGSDHREDGTPAPKKLRKPQAKKG